MRGLLVLIVISLINLSACGGGGGGGQVSTVVSPGVTAKFEVFLGGLNFPVRTTFLPDGRLLYLELLTGAVRLVDGQTLQPEPVYQVPVPSEGVNGLVGISVDPAFASNNFIYLYHTHPSPLRNRLIRFTLRDGMGREEQVLLDNLPVGIHNGGALTFSSDGLLFVSVGEAGDPSLSQDLSSLSGKILRIGRDGGVPGDNPIPGSQIFASGFRNVFGLSVYPINGALFAADNGPSCDDEINLVANGGNYGWRPDQPCGDQDPSFIAPLVRINPSIGITGSTFYRGSDFPELNNDLLVTDFNTGTLRRFSVSGSPLSLTELPPLLSGDFGPLTDVSVSPDGKIYLSAGSSIIRVARG